MARGRPLATSSVHGDPAQTPDGSRQGKVFLMKRWFLVPFGLVMLLAAGCAGGERATGPEGGDLAREGQPAPSFRLPSGRASSVSLADFRGKRQVLLYFSMGLG